MNNKTLILIGVVAILSCVIVGGGIGLISSSQNPLEEIGSSRSTVEINIYGGSSYTFHTKTIDSMINNMEKYNETNNSDIIEWLRGFDGTKYILIDDGGGEYYIIERTQYDLLSNDLSTKNLEYLKTYTALVKVNIIETKTTQGLVMSDIYYIKNPELIGTKKHN